MPASLIEGLAQMSAPSGSMLMLLFKATLILVFALGITVVMQKASAGARHLVWLVTLGTLLIVPAIAVWSPLRLEILPPATAQSAPKLSEVGAPVVPSALVEDAAQPAPATSYTTDDFRERSAINIAGFEGVSLLFAIWGAVVILIATWLAWGAIAVRRIVRRAHPLDTQDWLTPLWEIADRLELDEPPRLLGSNDAKMPFACGFITPTIVLPANCEEWTADRRMAVLLHELAHVKRRDLIGHTLGRLACAVYWFHPLVWTAAKQLRNESERACDDLALSCGAKASDYAEHLLDIVTSVRHDATPAVALAMARRKDFEGRMLAILDPELRHSTPNRRQSVALAGSLALIAIAVGAAAPAPRAATVVAGQTPDTTPAAVGHDTFVPNATADRLADIVKKSLSLDTEAIADAEADATAESDAGSTARAEPEVRVSANALAVAVAKATTSSESSIIVDLGDGRFAQIANAEPDERPSLLANILLTEKDASFRRTAAWGLSEYAGMEVAAKALASALSRDSDAGVREMAAWALADARQRSPAVAALINALARDANEDVRATAAWSLGSIGDDDAVAPLVAALADKGRGIQARAAWAIGSVEPGRAPPQLVALLRHEQPKMRQLAAWALYQIEDPSTAPALNAALKAEPNNALKIAYIRALAALGEKSVDAIRGLLTSTDPALKQMAIRALAGGDGAGPWPWPWPEPRPSP